MFRNSRNLVQQFFYFIGNSELRLQSWLHGSGLQSSKLGLRNCCVHLEMDEERSFSFELRKFIIFRSLRNVRTWNGLTKVRKTTVLQKLLLGTYYTMKVQGQVSSIIQYVRKQILVADVINIRVTTTIKIAHISLMQEQKCISDLHFVSKFVGELYTQNDLVIQIS